MYLKRIKDYRFGHDHGYGVYDFRIGYHFPHLDVQFNVDVYLMKTGICEILNARNLTTGTYMF